MSDRNIVDYNGLQTYDNKIKEYISEVGNTNYAPMSHTHYLGDIGFTPDNGTIPNDDVYRLKGFRNCQIFVNYLHIFFFNIILNIEGEWMSVIYPSIDKFLNTIDSKYELVHLVAQRSREITQKGNLQMPKEEYKSYKNIGKALEEVAKGLITIKK